MLTADKQLRLALLLLVVIGLAWGRGSGHSVRDSMEDNDSNSLKVKSSFRMSIPLFMRNAAGVDDSSTKTSQPVTTTTTTQTTPSTRSDGQCDTITSCMNGGTLQSNNNGSCPKCQCAPGCSGIRCETCYPGSTTTVMPPPSNIVSTMCLNGGMPVIATNGSYKCNCPGHLRGDFCELSNLYCSGGYDDIARYYYSCKNGAKLIYNKFTQTCSCSCPPCYHGLECEFYINNCDPSSINQANVTKPTCSTLECIQGMVVQSNETSCKCACTRSQSGEYCEIFNTLYTKIDCHAGTPYHDPVTYTTKCACPTGHYGDNCQYVATAYQLPASTRPNCNINICLNGGTFVSGSNGTCRCNCAVGYQGEWCEYIQECYALYGLTCNNGGSPSYNPSSKTCACSCSPCYYGSNCELYDSGCNSSPSVTQSPTFTKPTCSTISCLYGMVLQSNDETSCECACAVKYSGEYCDLYNTFDKSWFLCNHVGTIYYNVSVRMYQCVCPPGYYGDYCTYRI